MFQLLCGCWGSAVKHIYRSSFLWNLPSHEGKTEKQTNGRVKCRTIKLNGMEKNKAGGAGGQGNIWVVNHKGEFRSVRKLSWGPGVETQER